MSGFLVHVLQAQAWAVLLIVGTLVFVEDAVFVGFLVPGESAAIIGGVAARLGHVPVWAVAATVILAAIAGDSVGYEVGRRFGPGLLRHRILRTQRSRIEQSQDFLARRGGVAVLLGRWVAFLRAMMPALAGASTMRYRTFLIFNSVGGMIWGAVVVTLGYAAGTSYQVLESNLGRGTAVTVGAVVVVAVIGWRVRQGRVAAVRGHDDGLMGLERDSTRAQPCSGCGDR